MMGPPPRLPVVGPVQYVFSRIDGVHVAYREITVIEIKDDAAFVAARSTGHASDR